MTDEEMIEMLRNSVGVSEAACSAARKAADRIEQLNAKLDKAEWLLTDAMVQLEEGKIKTRRNRADLIRKFLNDIRGQQND
jgi:hypothetical protein